MGIFLLALTLLLEGAGMVLSYWYGVKVFGYMLAVLWDTLFPTLPVSQAGVGLAFVWLNLAFHLAMFAVAGARYTLIWLKLGTPSERQEMAVALVYARIIRGMGLRTPRRFRFSPDPGLEVGFIGPWLVIRDTLLKESRLLPPLLLHELAHYNSSDVWLRLVLAFFPPKWCGLYIVFGQGVGIGPLLLYIFWNWYWRRREYAADALVARLGLREALIEALEEVKLPRNRERNVFLRDVPYAEERIGRLQHGKPPYE